MEKNKERTDLIIGRNAVKEALRAKRAIDTIFIAKSIAHSAISEILKQAKEQDILLKEADGKKLDFMSGHAAHQGIVAVAAVKSYVTVDDIFERSEQRKEPPFIIILDELEDPHNLGAVIRTAECVGAHGVIIPKRRSVGLTYTVGKASAGGLEYMLVSRVTNIASTIDDLKKRRVWIYGADMGGSTWCETDLKGPIGLVIGNEGRGISRLIKEKCDQMISLPMVGQIHSLNASVAAGVLMYEIARQRLGLKAR